MTLTREDIIAAFEDVADNLQAEDSGAAADIYGRAAKIRGQIQDEQER